MLENYKPTLTLDPNAEEEVSAIELEVKKENAEDVYFVFGMGANGCVS